MALISLSVGACSHGPQLISEKRMMDPSEVTSVAEKQVKTRVDRRPSVTKVAIIGVNGWRTVGNNRRGHHSNWDPTASTRETIQEGVAVRDTVNDLSKGIPCRALEATFDSLLSALGAVGLQAVPVADKLAASALGKRAEHPGGMLACVASKARVSSMSLIGAGFATAFGRRDRLSEYAEDMAAFINETGVDGVLMAVLGSDDTLGPEASSMALFAKAPDGVVNLGWEGHMQDNRIRFEPVVAKPSTDDERIQNIGRVYHHTFQLLAAKLAADSRK
jgi:hypothetical protein